MPEIDDTGHGVFPIEDQQVVLFDRAWPDGVPETELRLFDLLDGESRRTALERLGAVLDVAEGLASVAEGGGRLGLSRSAFHDLRRRWSSSKAISSLVPHVGRAARPPRVDIEEARSIVVSAAAGPGRNPLLAAAWRLVEGNGGLSNGDLARMLVAEAAGKMSKPTALALVRSLRQAGRSRPDVLARTYSTQLLLDLSAVAMLVADGGLPEPAIGSFLVERASGLILASWAGTRRATFRGQRVTLERGLAFLGRDLADRSGDAMPVVHVVVAAPTGDAEAAAVRRLSEIVPADRLHLGGQRRFGARLMSMLGRRIGRLDIRPGSTVPDGPLPRPSLSYLQEPVEPSVADGVVSDHVARHNAPILSRLREQGLIGRDGVARGVMARALEPMIAALRD